MTKAIDNCSETVYNYTYNELGNIKAETRNGETFKTLEYDRHNRLTKTTVNTSDETLVYTPIYETRDSDGAIYADNAIKGMTLKGIFEQSVNKDKYGRPTRTSLRVNEDTIYDECGNECCEFTEELLASEYSYLESNFRLTDIVDTVTHKVNGYISDKLKHKYDGNGNITGIYREGEQEVCTECGCDECGNPIYTTTTQPKDVPVVEYFYDGLNRLTRENNYVLGKTYTYKYDAAGNILSKSTYAVTSGAVITPIDVKLYKYANTGWKDKLVNYDGVGISYDMMGNPWSYRGHSLEWSRIRLLTKWDDIEMEYNASGMRTRKGDTYYELDGNNIISETTNGNTIRYYYGNGGIVGFRYNGNRYYYEKNLHGDIIGIYDEDGSKLCEYVYDAWGNCSIENDVSDARIGEVNSFRYRGYYYDSDIGLYYLKSRYYDAITGRFINADSLNYLGANGDLCAFNLFAYCSCNPVMRRDSNGRFASWFLLLLAAAAGVTMSGCGKNSGGEDLNMNDYYNEFYGELDNGGQRYSTLDKALEKGIDNLFTYLEEDYEYEVGCTIYTLEGVPGYFVGRCHTDKNKESVEAKYGEDQTPIAFIHTHPWHNDNIIYRENELEYLRNLHRDYGYEVSSYVVDPCGCVYALRYDAKDHMKYEVIHFSESRG